MALCPQCARDGRPPDVLVRYVDGIGRPLCGCDVTFYVLPPGISHREFSDMMYQAKKLAEARLADLGIRVGVVRSPDAPTEEAASSGRIQGAEARDRDSADKP